MGKATVIAGAFSIVNFDHSPLAWEWRSWDGSLKGVWVRCAGVAAIEVLADSEKHLLNSAMLELVGSRADHKAVACVKGNRAYWIYLAASLAF